jgi:hypothetical protein
MPAFQQEGADLIDDADGALADQPLSHPLQNP